MADLGRDGDPQGHRHRDQLGKALGMGAREGPGAELCLFPTPTPPPGRPISGEGHISLPETERHHGLEEGEASLLLTTLTHQEEAIPSLLSPELIRSYGGLARLCTRAPALGSNPDFTPPFLVPAEDPMF